jgi:autotransporter-associated beta strand protein
MQQSRIVEDARFQLPVEIYRLFLIEQAGKPQPAPVSHIIERGIYGVTLDANSRPVMRAELSVRVFDPARCREIPILSTALAWDAATVNGKPGSLAAKPGWLVLMPDKPGVYELAATAKLGRQWAKQARVALDVTRSVRTGAKFDAAGDWHISAVGSTGLTASAPTGSAASAPAEAGTHVELAMPPTDRVDIAWTRPVKLPPRPPQFEVTGAIAWNIDAGRQQVSARMNVRFLGGPADRLELAIPAGVVRCTITGPDVREMRISGGTAEVFLRGKLTGQTRLNVSYELPAGPAGQGAGAVKPLPAPRLADGHWSAGTLVVTNTAGASELVADNVRSLREIYESDIPADARSILAGKPVLAYEITARDFDASVEVLDLGEFALQESIADLAHYQVLLRPDGSVMCKVDYEIRNRTSQFLRVRMPAGSTVLSARVNDVPTALTPLAGEAGVSLLPLVRSKASVKGLVSFPVQIVLLYRAAALARRGLADVPLPTIDLPIAYGWCDLYAPEGLAVSQWSGPMRNVERLSSETAIASLGYGAGELAEGYREDKRLKLLTAPPKPTPKPKPVAPNSPIAGLWRAERRVPDAPVVQVGPKPAAKPAEGEPRVLYLGFDPNNPTKVGQSLPIELPTVVTQQLETSVSVPEGGTLLLGGQIAGQSLLARNYYSAGKDYYEKGRYEQAAESLGNAARLAPGSVEAENAKRLLANIDVVQGKGQGKGKPASQQEKALGRQVQTEIAGQNLKLEQQQQAYIEQAGKALKGGNFDEAQAAYKAAEGLGGQLLAKGAGKGEQDARLRQSRQELAQLEERQSNQADQLRLQYEHFKTSGELNKALAVGNTLKGLVIEGEQKKALTGELEKLAIASVQHSDRLDRVEMAAKAELVPAPDKLSSAMSVTNVVDSSGSMTTDPSSGLSVGWGGEHRIEAQRRLERKLAPSGDRPAGGEADRTADEAMDIERTKALPSFQMEQAGGRKTTVPTGQAAPDFNYPYRLGPWANLPKWRQGEPSGAQAGDSSRPSGVNINTLGVDPHALPVGWGSWQAGQAPASTGGQGGGSGPGIYDDTTGGSHSSRDDAMTKEKLMDNFVRLVQAEIDRQSNQAGAQTNAGAKTRVYDVRDLLVPVPDFEGPRIELRQAAQSSAGTGGGGGGGGGGGQGIFAEKLPPGSGGGGGGTGLFADTSDSDAHRRRMTPKEKAMENLIALMRNCIDRESWADPDAGPTEGTPGVVRIENGKLDVTQILQNHQAIVELIEKLREARTPPAQRAAALTPAPTAADADAVVREKLKKQIKLFSFGDLDLSDVIEFLRQYSSIDIKVNWPALKEAGVERTRETSVNAHDITVKQALDLLLRTVSGVAAGPEFEVQYVIDGGVLTISTRADLAKKTARRVYEVSDLLDPAPDFDPSRVESPQDAATTGKLKMEIERLSFADIDFKDVITFFREYSEINIHVNWRALTAAGIEQTTKVSIDVRKVTVQRALDLVLRDVSGSGAAAGPESELQYWNDGGMLVISTRADLARQHITKVYDVRNLLTWDGSGAARRWEDMDQEDRQVVLENIGDLISLMRNSIDRESWSDPTSGPTPGTPGYVQTLSGMLVVTQTPENHRTLAEMFEHLRKAFAAHDPQTPIETAADAAARDMLKREIERLSFADIDFKDVISFLREYSDANIHVNWRALTAAGIEQTTKVSIDLRNITVKRAMEIVLRDVSRAGAAAGPESELRHIIDGGVLTISTKADLAKEPIRKIYDIRDLLPPAPRGAAGQAEPPAIRRQRWLARKKAQEHIISLMRNVIDRESWADPTSGPTAGTPGFVQAMSGLLVVTQTPENHRALAELFEKVRKALEAQDRPAPSESAADTALRDKLTRKIERLNFTGAGLRDVITFFREYSDANIHVYWRALIQAGIEPTTKVSLNVRNVTVKQALDMVLRKASGTGPAAGPESELRGVIEDGVLIISTKADLARDAVRRVYDVRDLLLRVQDISGPDAEAQGGFGFAGQGIFTMQHASAARRQAERANERLLENLFVLIRNAIDPESWADPEAGPTVGQPGFVQALNGLLVVAQTAENQQAVSELIEKLRQAKAVQDRPAPAGARGSGGTGGGQGAVQRQPAAPAQPSLQPPAQPSAQPPAQPSAQPAQPAPGVVTRVYDVRDLAIGSDGARTPDELNRRAEDLAAKARAAIGAPDGRAGRVGVDNGRLVVTADLGGQRSAQQLLGRLREISGPQVELGGNIAEQEARGLVKTGAGTLTTNGALYRGDTVVSAGTMVYTGGTFLGDTSVDFLAAATAGAGREAAKAQFQDFIRRNYDWQFTTGGGTGAQDMAANMNGAAMSNVAMTRMQAEAPILDGGRSQFDARSHDMWVANLAATLSSNLGQSVNVNSSNIAVTPAEASQLGIQFQQGVNSVRYATVDEAQLRTLRQLEARQAAAGKAAPANPRLQNTIVGTEALLSGGQRAYVARALEGSNTFTLAGNPIALPHEKYILLDAGGYLTAAKASQMQHWTQPVSKEDVGFADVPQELDVPRVGNLVRFEKTLIRPADRLTIRAEYTWKGAVK